MTLSLIIQVKTVSEKNNRDFFRKKAKRTQSQRLAVKETMELVLPRLLTHWWAQKPGFRFQKLVKPVAVTLTRVAPSGGLDEEDNLPLSLSGVRDQVAESLGLANDRQPDWVTWKYGQRRGKPKEYAVEIDIRERLPKRIIRVDFERKELPLLVVARGYAGFTVPVGPPSWVSDSFLVWAGSEEEGRNTVSLHLNSSGIDFRWPSADGECTHVAV